VGGNRYKALESIKKQCNLSLRVNSLNVTDDPSREGAQRRQEASALSDEQIVQSVRAGDTEVFAVLLRRHNQRVYRAARSVLRDDTEAEEVAQEAWVRAFHHLDQFAGRGRFATWVTRIALYEAWARARRIRKGVGVPESGADEMAPARASSDDPERAASDREIHGLIEAAIDALPEKYRLVFILREVEGLSTIEAAGSLKLSLVTVKTRLHRARALLRNELLARAGQGIAGSFRFLGRQCDRMVGDVLCRIRPAGSFLVVSPDPCRTGAGEEFPQ
jgi:RNA polymerase sigma-70 factor (ECF subfamily)